MALFDGTAPALSAGGYFEALLGSPAALIDGEDDHVLHATAGALQLFGHTRDSMFDLYTFGACFGAPANLSFCVNSEPRAHEVCLKSALGASVWCVLVRIPCVFCDDPANLSIVFFCRAGSTPPSQRLQPSTLIDSMLLQYADDFGDALQAERHSPLLVSG